MKEKKLTILIPIKEEDTITVSTLPVANANNINVIYKHNGVYKRTWYNPNTNQYEYHEVVDREFPYLGKPIEIYDFTYDATRMGTAPTITAQGVMWYADKDASGKDKTLEDLWEQTCHVLFNGENYYLKQIPTSSKSNEDARYKYDIDFISERVVLEQVYLYDVVQPFVTERPVSENSTFSFYGDINELAKRINASLLRSGLLSLVYRDNQNTLSHPRLLTDRTRAGNEQFFSYEEWNSIGLGSYNGVLDTSDPYVTLTAEGDYSHYHNTIYDHYNGDYNEYLRNEVYQLDSDGNFIMSGYQCKIGKDKKSSNTTSEEKLVSFENNTIHEALQQFYDTFEQQYYIYREKNSNGDFTGSTIIMIGDCEHDFAEVNATGDDFVRDDNGIPSTTRPFAYGIDNELLSIEKTNTTEKIITRITGVGGTENIPWHYPNPTADGWIKPIYKIGGVEQNIAIGFPTSEGLTTADSVRYEKFLKNRIGDVFQYGLTKQTLIKSGYRKALSGVGYEETGQQRTFVSLVYLLNVANGYNMPAFSVNLSLADNSNVTDIKAKLRDNTAGVDIVDYDSSQSYQNPNDFQLAFSLRDGSRFVSLTAGHKYYLYVQMFMSDGMPLTNEYDDTGFYYPEVVETQYDEEGSSYVIRTSDNFYRESGLTFRSNQYEAGVYVDSGTNSVVNPMPVVIGRKYRDEASGNIYECKRISQFIPNYDANPRMGFEEWISTFLSFEIPIRDLDGWYKKNKRVTFEDYGMTTPSQTPDWTHTVEFKRIKWVTPQSTLMPEVYIKTDGEHRFYNAHNYYPLQTGVADTLIGETLSGAYITNPIYKEKESDADNKHYKFENEYLQIKPHEHIETFSDIKPTIKEQTNEINGEQRRIDVIQEFAYDELDNDEVWENNDDGNVSGDYKHPYFFAKLRPLGFNIFDMALQDDMVISMTTGNCGACNFKIAVDENTKKNPVQIWEHDVYEGSLLIASKLKYRAGSLCRYGVDLTNLYYDIDGNAVRVDSRNGNREGFIVTADFTTLYTPPVYTANLVLNGEVGSLKQNGKNHFAGDVITSGRFLNSQQDTTENYVWVALMKDTESYGVLMPSARPDYSDGNFSVYIRPKAITDVQSPTSTASEDEDKADKFVLTNIRLPQVFLRRAERELSRKLVAYMNDNNYQKFNFSIVFSRIFLAQNAAVDDFLNENSVLYVSFNRRTYRQYVKHYTYKMQNGDVLPEITVEMNEDLSVSRTFAELQSNIVQHYFDIADQHAQRLVTQTEERILGKTIGRNSNTIVNGNIVSRSGSTSFNDLDLISSLLSQKVSETKENLEVNHYKKTDFVIESDKIMIGTEIVIPTKLFLDEVMAKINAFNSAVANKGDEVTWNGWE